MFPGTGEKKKTATSFLFFCILANLWTSKLVFGEQAPPKEPCSVELSHEQMFSFGEGFGSARNQPR